MAALKSAKAKFTLHLAGANGKTNGQKKGTILLKGQKYKITLDDQEIICDAKSVWTYSKANNEVQVSTYSPEEQAISPAKLFTNFYDKEYRYRYLTEKKVNGKACNIVELTPTDKSKQFAKVELAVEKSSQTISGGTIYEKNGNQFQYVVAGFTADPPVADAQFVWDAKSHPGVEVVDLR